MTIKVSLKEKYISHKEFPKLMIANNNLIVLFIKEGVGMVVNNDGIYDFGRYSETWQSKLFKDYNRKLILKNDK